MDEFDPEAEWHAWGMAVQEAQTRKLLKLNKHDLLVLARHFKIPYPEDFVDSWSHGGKEELARTIA